MNAGFSTVRSRSGFSLIEMLLVVVLIGIMLAIGLPRLRETKIRSDVHSARVTLVSLYAQARAAAVQTSRTTTLNVGTTRAWVTATPRISYLAGSTTDTIGTVREFLQTYGVTLSAAPVNQLRVDPRGFGSSSATTITLTNSGIVDSITITAFGRIER